jgi:hypothetical protein
LERQALLISEKIRHVFPPVVSPPTKGGYIYIEIIATEKATPSISAS